MSTIHQNWVLDIIEQSNESETHVCGN